MPTSIRPRASGVTLLELTTVLALAAVALSVAVPPALGVRDRWAVHLATTEVAALVARARAEAPARGGLKVEIDEAMDRVRLLKVDSVLSAVRPGARGVAVDIVGSAARAELGFDALGVGRIASRRVVLRRGRAADTLVVSSYGRVTR